MRFFILSIFLALASCTIVAQNTTTSFNVGGLKVILKPTVKDVISVRMFYRGGVSNYTPEQTGIEDMALVAAVECGTKKYNKNTFKDLQDAYGIDIGGSSGRDFGNISMTCISKYFNEGWDLFSEAIVNPIFDARELDLLRAKMISDLQQQEGDPENYLEQMALKHAFKDTPYATQPAGTETTLSKFTTADVKNYYAGILNKNQMFLVVVGKISKDELTKKINSTLASIPVKPYSPKNIELTSFKGSSLVTEQREVATNYITGILNAPIMSSEDYIPYRLAVSVLSSNLFREIRTKRNLSYAPDAHIVNGRISYTSVNVSTTDPKASVEVIVNELKDIQDGTISEVGLEELKGSFITNNYMREQSSAAMAVTLGQAEVMGDWKLADELVNKVKAATVEKIRDVAMKYISGVKWTYLGDVKAATAASSAFSLSVD